MLMGGQTGRVALVTGANKGIGLETARGIGREGATVYVGSRQTQAGEVAAKALREDGIDARAIELDVTKPATIAAAAATIGRAFGRLDILVNNAAIGLDRIAPSETDLQTMRETFETNVFGVVAVTQAMLPLLRESSSARIVNVSSDFGSLTLNADPTMPHAKGISLSYPASKAALNGVTVAFAKELRGTPIKVNLANPGYTDTDMTTVVGRISGRGAAQGAVAIVRMALIDDDGPHGVFVDENGTVPW
jgi:NAD(P)-dependent dehydrogenase (short-subunit alcohol dehydrogenase family)